MPQSAPPEYKEAAALAGGIVGGFAGGGVGSKIQGLLSPKSLVPVSQAASPVMRPPPSEPLSLSSGREIPRLNAGAPQARIGEPSAVTPPSVISAPGRIQPNHLSTIKTPVPPETAYPNPIADKLQELQKNVLPSDASEPAVNPSITDPSVYEHTPKVLKERGIDTFTKASNKRQQADLDELNKITDRIIETRESNPNWTDDIQAAKDNFFQKKYDQINLTSPKDKEANRKIISDKYLKNNNLGDNSSVVDVDLKGEQVLNREEIGNMATELGVTRNTIKRSSMSDLLKHRVTLKSPNDISGFQGEPIKSPSAFANKNKPLEDMNVGIEPDPQPEPAAPETARQVREKKYDDYFSSMTALDDPKTHDVSVPWVVGKAKELGRSPSEAEEDLKISDVPQDKIDAAIKQHYPNPIEDEIDSFEDITDC